MAQPPVIYVLSGPNGAGKSTGAATVLPEFGTNEFVNADEIAKTLESRSPIEAGRIMLARMRELREAGASFAFETTLASRTFVPFLNEARDSGYFVHLVYVWLRNPSLAKARVALRVRRGGHNIPPDDIERRYWRGIQNFFDLYYDVVNAWTLCDNSGQKIVVVAESSGSSNPTIHDPKRFGEIKLAAKRKKKL